MENMSEDILFDILLWLPVVSLLRFKRVCKSWLALIESPTFVNQHLHHRSGEDALIVFYSKSGNLHFCLFSGNRYEVQTTIDFDGQSCTTIGANDGHIDLDLVDSCDGIICLHNGWSGDVALWNPALKQLKLLPKSSIPHQRYNPGDTYIQFTVIGFGFDAKANDYKVVRIIWQYPAGPEVNQVEVYNLRTSFSWRIIHKNGAFPFKSLAVYSDHATSKNGKCFWLGHNNRDSILVAFDLKNEVFETMSLPDSQESKTRCYALDFLNEKLAYIRGLAVYPNFNGSFEIWVLNEFGVKESWNKIYSIGPTPYLGKGGMYPTGFSMNGKLLLLRTCFPSRFIDELYLYNLDTQKGTKESYTPIQEPNPDSLRSFLHYNESLVSLKIFANGMD